MVRDAQTCTISEFVGRHLLPASVRPNTRQVCFGRKKLFLGKFTALLVLNQTTFTPKTGRRIPVGRELGWNANSGSDSITRRISCRRCCLIVSIYPFVCREISFNNFTFVFRGLFIGYVAAGASWVAYTIKAISDRHSRRSREMFAAGYLFAYSHRVQTAFATWSLENLPPKIWCSQ